MSTMYFESIAYVGKIGVSFDGRHYIVEAEACSKHNGEKKTIKSFHVYEDVAKEKQKECLRVVTRNDQASPISSDEYDILISRINKIKR